MHTVPHGPRLSLVVLAPLLLVAGLAAVRGNDPQPVGSEATPLGPPWISMEIPANPLDPTTRGAAFLVHAYHHARSAGLPLAGTAEGIVDGERRSVELDFTETSRPGVYAVKAVWPEVGSWVLKIRVEGRADATLLVELGPNGGLRDDRYHGHQTNAVTLSSVRVVPGDVSEGQIDSRLKALAARTSD
ncbi:MAG: hypothetical protein ACE5JR_05755 [Gemmatimonadota bacterium]